MSILFCFVLVIGGTGMVGSIIFAWLQGYDRELFQYSHLNKAQLNGCYNQLL